MIKYKPQVIANSPKFCGIRTFMRLPHVKTVEDVDFVIAGAPFDTGSTFKTGSRFGPSSIRENSLLMRPYSLNLDVDIFEHLSGVDYGDFPIIPGYIEDTYQVIEQEMQTIVDQEVFPVVLGGDHSITLGELRAVAKKYGPVALVHFDSHTDTVDNYWGKKYTHGTPFIRAVEEGLIDPAHSIQVGIRGTQSHADDLKVSEDLGLKVVTANEMHEVGIKETGRLIRERVGNSKAFLTFDIDFVDPAYAPGTGTTEIGGFTSYETMKLIRELKDIYLVGCDIVEVMPSLDPSSITAYTAASTAHEIISLIALQKKNGFR